ncbi:MAG: hypothetical protein ACKOXJ_00640, partial [Alphaproteobacteria bacterium]
SILKKITSIKTPENEFRPKVKEDIDETIQRYINEKRAELKNNGSGESIEFTADDVKDVLERLNKYVDTKIEKCESVSNRSIELEQYKSYKAFITKAITKIRYAKPVRFRIKPENAPLPNLKFDEKNPYLILTQLTSFESPENKFQRKVKKDIKKITEMLRDNLHEAKYAKLINGGSDDITNFTHDDAKDVLEMLKKYIDKKIKAKETEKNGLKDWNYDEQTNIQIEIKQYNSYKKIIEKAIPEIDQGKGRIQEYYKEKEKLATKQMRKIRQNPKDDINANWETRQKAINELCKNDTLGGFKEIKTLKKIIDQECKKISDDKAFKKRNDQITKSEERKRNTPTEPTSWQDRIRGLVVGGREIGG